MKSLIRRSATPFGAIIAAFLLLIVVIAIIVVSRAGATNGQSQTGRLITIHDRGTEKVIMSDAATVGDALKDANVQLDSSDTVEPAVTEKLVASEYNINIYRARPVIVVDGATKQKIITPYQTADQIAKGAGITLYPEDKTTLAPSDDITADGAGLVLTIDRATPFTFTLYGTTTDARAQGSTVGAMLKEKGVTLTADDHVSPDQSTPLTNGLAVRVWREGKQTITVAEPVAFTTQKIQDGDYNVGYDAVQTPGVNGSQSVTYEVTIQDGKEVGRTPIASIVTVQPVQQVEIVGVKVALSRSYSADRVSVMTQAGIADSDQGYAAYIVDHEDASWCPTRWQGQSGCPAVYSALYSEGAQIGYGLCQATPGNKMATAGDDWRTNPVTQMKWCTSYAVSRYGSWLAAYTFKVQKGWW
ncbi:MAG: exported protein of unknown function [Candidatus Saccharibacteria bacterium]|nr:exported protein of unknown function [Candidatus Saccharibacteria bacterium]